jgi:CelD/BcsL family acetyltransferase involved in cellulose biosynthesis
MNADLETCTKPQQPLHVDGRGAADEQVFIADAVSDPLWERLVAQHRTSVFHSPAWLRVLQDTYGFPLRASMLRGAAGDPLGGLVYAEVDDIRGPRLVSLPFSDFCDPIVADDAAWQAVIADVLGDARRFDLRCVHSEEPLRDPRLAEVGRARWHAIEVEQDEGEAWQRLHPSARRAIRKAEGAGVTVEQATSERQLREFFELHLRVRRRKYGLLAQPFAFFEHIWAQFLEQGSGVLILARVDGRAVAGCLFLEWQDTLYYKFNASDLDTLAVRPNDRVLWEGLRYARTRDLQRLDFGLTDWDQHGLVQYKRKYATEERTITMLRHAPSPPEQPDRAAPLLRQLTDLLVDEAVPDDVAERGGALLYRHFA